MFLGSMVLPIKFSYCMYMTPLVPCPEIKWRKTAQNVLLSSSKKGRKRRFTPGLAFVSACWDQPASVHINFKRKNASEWPKLNGFAGDIFLLVRSKPSGEWQLSAAFCRCYSEDSYFSISAGNSGVLH